MTKKMKIGDIIISNEELTNRIDELADQINNDYKDSNAEMVLLGILKGCFVFMSDISRRLKGDIIVDFMQVSSYGNGTESTGNIKIIKDTSINLEGKDVLIIEDIVDSGNTLSKLTKILEGKNPKSVRVCALLSKPSRRQVEFEADYTGFEIPDKFIIGYGLDCDEKFRELPYIAEVIIEG